jgi:transcriptional regulator with XRE-family HTH domain
MSAREAFGPNLRRIRIQRGVSLRQIAEATKVSEDLWDGLEHNDFDRWPNGIFARSYIREYARIIGVDPDGTVDEFCRWFTQGDRRVLRLVREQAQIVGHERLDYRDDVPPDIERDRRGLAAVPPQPERPARATVAAIFLRLRRALNKA